MAKIINGKRYDTDTARLVGYRDNGCGIGDLGYVCESLFCKRTGEYFLYGEGGANTCYAEPRENNSWIGGSVYSPLTALAAAKWAAENLDADEYEAEFGAIDECDETTLVSLHMPTSLHKELKRRASEAGQSFSAYANKILLDSAKGR